MFNLLVVGREDGWQGPPWIVGLDRCVREYTNTSITNKYGDLTPDNVKELIRFPCIFAFEEACKLDPHFGVISAVIRRDNEVKLSYKLLPLSKFISWSDLKELEFELDIQRLEMNRTHWAVKDVNLAKELHAKSVALPNWARSLDKTVDITAHEFQVALSFPGELRPFVQEVAKELESQLGPNSYFYDENYTSQLAVPSLDTLLQDIYRSRAKLVVIFLCNDYQKKAVVWRRVSRHS